MSPSLVVDPDFSFGSLDARLASLGFQRDASVRPVTPDIIPGEPELAAWTRGPGGERLTYTFNPVVSLRVITGSGLDGDAGVRLTQRLPLLDTRAIERLLAEPDTRRVLLGLFAARTVSARGLAPAVAALTSHRDRAVQRAAEGTLQALRPEGEPTARERTLAVLQLLCEQAVPVLAALVGPEGPATLEAMRPRAEDYPRVFRPELVDAVRAAYEALWRTPPQVERLVAGELALRVDAAPAGMLGEDNELSKRFPGGYRALAPYLQPDRIWFVWRYVRAGKDAGMCYDGVVLVDERWVWFPKPYRIVGEVLASTAS